MQPSISIDFEDLGHRIGEREVLAGLSLRVHAGRIGVIGRNGSGKTTLTRLLAGLEAPARGRLRVAGIDPARDRRGALATIGLLFQNPDHQIILPTVGEEIGFGLRQQGLGRPQTDAAVAAMLERFGKAHWREAPVASLSQGQRHLVCLMAVLAMGPRLLVLDEPYAGLDIPTRMQLARHLEASGAGLVHVSHAPEDLAGYDHVLWLEGGRLREVGPAAPVLERFEAEMRRRGADDDLSDLPG